MCIGGLSAQGYVLKYVFLCMWVDVFDLLGSDCRMLWKRGRNGEARSPIGLSAANLANKTQTILLKSFNFRRVHLASAIF